MDQLTQLSFKTSILEARYLTVSDLTPGEVVTACIKKVSEKNIFLKISDHIDTVIWPSHFADINLRHPQKRFKEGGMLKCRVSRSKY